MLVQLGLHQSYVALRHRHRNTDWLIDVFFFPRNFNSLGLLRHLSRAGVDHMQDMHQEPREAHANSKVGASPKVLRNPDSA
jgi:hypothetical protein